MNGYSVKVAEASKELTKKEQIQLIQGDFEKLNDVTQEGAVLINVDWYAVLDIHNEKAQDKDYQNYVIKDKNGTFYSTGSASFWDSFIDIMNVMAGEDDWELKVIRKASKNRQGKEFLTCTVE